MSPVKVKTLIGKEWDIWGEPDEAEVFFFFLINPFIYGYVGSSLLHTDFL